MLLNLEQVHGENQQYHIFKCNAHTPTHRMINGKVSYIKHKQLSL
jgi:hypothetical protein